MTEHRLTIFDVQHGGCAILKTVHNGVTWVTMIDCGHKNNERGRWFPGDYLRSQGIYTVDFLIITNLDEDHVSGLPNLVGNVNITNIFSNPSVPPWAIKALKEQQGMGYGIEAVVRELTLRGLTKALPWLPDVGVQCFWNAYPNEFDDENNLSVVTLLTFGGVRVLFTGDMECAGFNRMLARDATVRGLVKNLDVFVAPHHGRESGVCPDLFDVYGCRPKLTVISDDCMQYDTQQTSAWYRDRTSGHPFKSEGKMRWVLTTRSDGNLDVMPSYPTMFVF